MTPLFKAILWVFVAFIALLHACHVRAQTADEFVTGVLAVPFKWHLSDKSASVGETLGGYLGYQTKAFHDLTITPVVGGGLAMVNQSTVVGAGVSIASGLIGRVGTTGTQGVQLGLICGVDWLGKSARYQYEGKPWLAFEVGYNFSL